MKTLASAVAWRYLAIATQFLIVVLVAKNLAIQDAGKYFAIFGLVTVGALLAGLGTPDGAVRHLPLLRESGHWRQIRSLVTRVLAVVVLTCAVGAATCIAVIWAGLALPTEALLSLSWWVAISLVWAIAQLLAGLGNGGLGALIGYSATNFCYLGTLVPYLLFASIPSLSGALLAASIGSWIAAMAAATSLVLVVRRLSTPAEAVCQTMPSGRRLLADGLGMMFARILQGSLVWVPLWILAAKNGPESAATYGAASRLAVAATAGVAALRFAIRPQIVLSYSRRDYRAIVQMSRRCSFISAIIPMSAVVLLIGIGDRMIEAVLGYEYRNVGAVLIALMFGVLAEAFGGISDEILKMTGRTPIVLGSLLAALLTITFGGINYAERGEVAVAWVTAMAFAVSYLAQVTWLVLKTPVGPWAIRRSYVRS